jgi:hypothetical protein
MTTAVIALNKLQKNIKTKVESVDFPEVSWKKVCFAGFFVSLALLIFYVFEINSLTGGSYLANEYEKQISKLSQENKSLEISFAESSFLGEVLGNIRTMNFQRTTSVKYIKISDGLAKATAINK